MGLGAIADIGKFIFGNKQKKEANKINPVWQQYQTSPWAKQQYATANNAYLDPSLGMRPQAERQIQAAGANFNSFVGRNATDGSQALALGAAGLGKTDSDISGMNMDFMKNKIGLLGNLNNAYGTMINEGTKEYESAAQKYQMDMAQKQALLTGAASNKFGAAGDLASLGIIAGQLGIGNNWFVKGNKSAAKLPVSGASGAYAGWTPGQRNNQNW
jgi:hypothetical protein